MSWAVLIKVACRITAYYKETIIEQFLLHNVNTIINSCLENSWKKHQEPFRHVISQSKFKNKGLYLLDLLLHTDGFLMRSGRHFKH